MLARLVRQQRTLLILDGLEPLQHPPGAQKGRVKDKPVQALVRNLATDNPGLCVITTRLEVADLAGRAGTESIDLDKLPPEAGAELLRQHGVKGSEQDLRAASEERGGHGLALTLLGTYLRDFCNGDVRRRHEIAVLDETANIEGSTHARRVMEAYESWLGTVRDKAPELQILHLLGLFDRPAEPAALAALRSEPEIPGLSEGIGARNDTVWNATLSRLRHARLVAPAEKDPTTPSHTPLDASPLDSHPLVREYFGERLKNSNREVWRAANERLYDYYRQAAPEYPDTLEAMLPLYSAVVHGCRAGLENEAASEVYLRRILRGAEFFSSKKLGALGAELTALAAFFEHIWDRPSSRLTAGARTWLLAQAGFRLRALGRLSEALQPTRASLHEAIAEENWKQASIRAGNLSELILTLGDVAGAVTTAKRSVELADLSRDTVEGSFRRATLADSLHQAGMWDESDALFREAEAMQAERQPRYPRLYSLRGYQYCDLLLSLAEPEDGSGLEGAEKRYRIACQQVQERVDGVFRWRSLPAWNPALDPLLDIALDHLSLGRAHLGLCLTGPHQPPNLHPAAAHLDWAVDGLREAGAEEFVARGLLARAVLRRVAANPESAAVDLREAQEIAERGSMRLHEADAHLEWTRLRLATGDLATARTHLDRARELVQECGYGRREREVTWLQGRLAALNGE